jgi:hypothetical protein
MVGRPSYPRSSRLRICADSGGENDYRVPSWKLELDRLAVETGLAITVPHFPPGTSKSNKIEHRLFSHIFMNGHGRPPTSHEVVLDLIGATAITTGLTLHAERDSATYPKGVKVSDEEVASMPLMAHDLHGEWNDAPGRPQSPEATSHAGAVTAT